MVKMAEINPNNRIMNKYECAKIHHLKRLSDQMLKTDSAIWSM